MKRYLKKYGFFLFSLVVFGSAAYTYMSGHVTVSSNVNGRELPIYSVETQSNKVAVTFDAAWGNEDIQKILDILESHKIHATFFMTGGFAEAYPDDVKAIYNAGHDLGNHSEHHKNMSQLTEEQQIKELMGVHDRVKELTGSEMFLFRPPYGDYNDAVIENAEKNGYYTIEWDVDSLDWKDYGKKSILDTVLNNKNLKNGSIIRFHNGAKFTAEALDEIITGLEKKGYTIVPVSQLIYKEDYHMDVTGRQFKN